MNNPWLGLSSYTEEALNEYKFYGRTTAIATLTALIRSNLFVTLYGRSGIGKTSLLQAGVFPQLRKSGFSPVAIRLNTVTDGSVPAAKVLWDALTEKLKAIGYTYTQYDSRDLYHPDFHDPMVFRYLFGAGRFVNSENKTTSSVMVLDQFEEILYNAPKASRLLITQLYALIDDNYNLQISHPSWHEETNFRIVVSIREDDLFLFEDWIDTLNYADLKSNRYRLLPLTEQEAREIILEPLKSSADIFDKEQQEEIADKIIDLARTSSQNINTLMLSLLCYVLYEDSIAKKKPITLSDLENYDNIIETYYLEVIKNVPLNQRYYLEDHLLDESGRRTYIYKEDLNKFAPDAEKFIGNTNQRLFNVNQGRVEFIHDQLASAVSKIRTSRKKVRRKINRPKIVVGVLFVLLLFILSSSPRNEGSKILRGYDKIKGDGNVETVVLESGNDSIQCTIDDCPNLKIIQIKNNNGNYNIINCPSLINIEVPDSFIGHILCYNCPNLGPEIKKENFFLPLNEVQWYNEGDTASCKIYKSLFAEAIIQVTGKGPYYIDTLTRRVVVSENPIFHNAERKHILMSVMHVSDSVKRTLNCYVPYGYKEKFSRLYEFQSFKSINESSFLETSRYALEYKISSISIFFNKHVNRIWRNLAAIGIIIVQLLFWFTSYGWIKSIAKYKKWGYKSRIYIFLLSFLYGLGMSAFAIISFMVFYWLTYNWIFPCNQPVSTAIGTLGCLVSMILVYYESFKLDKLWSNMKYKVLKR